MLLRQTKEEIDQKEEEVLIIGLNSTCLYGFDNNYALKYTYINKPMVNIINFKISIDLSHSLHILNSHSFFHHFKSHIYLMLDVI